MVFHRSVDVRERSGVWNGPSTHLKGSDKILHFEQFTIDSGLCGRYQAAMIDGAQRMDFSGGFGDGSIIFGGGEELVQEGNGEMRHVAGDENVPVALGHLERGVEAADGTAIFDCVRNNGKPEVRVFIDGSDQGNVTRGRTDFIGDGFDHGDSVEREQGFIAAHAPAGSAHQNKARSSHEMILATSGSIVELNKKVYICFLVAFAMLAASPSRAADVAPAPVVRKTTVVRADPRTGKLVRSVIVSQRPAAAASLPANSDLNAMVASAAKAHDVDPLLVHSIIKVESNYDAHAVSSKGAEGLMQLMPSTARMLGVSDSFDPQQNIEAGVKYLKKLQDIYKDDRLALAAYNAGPGSVNKYNAVPPYAETQNYVERVGKRYDAAKRAADAAKPVVETKTEVKVDEKPAEVKLAAVEPFIDENGRLHLKTTP
jgi:hypothetical protein